MIKTAAAVGFSSCRPADSRDTSGAAFPSPAWLFGAAAAGRSRGLCWSPACPSDCPESDDPPDREYDISVLEHKIDRHGNDTESRLGFSNY